jgi:hypothetical protein
VRRALILLLWVGLAYADNSAPSGKPPRQMLSDWQLHWPAKLPCSNFVSADVIIEEPIDLVLHAAPKPLRFSHTEGQAIGAPHGPPGANRRYPLPADFDVTTIDRVTASRADGVLLIFYCSEKLTGDVAWTLTTRKDAWGDVKLKSDAQLAVPALCDDAALADKSSAAAEQKAMESTLAELARAVCKGMPCNQASRALLAMPIPLGAPSEFVRDSTRGDGWRARFARAEDSLQCWVKKNPIGEDRACVLQRGKLSLREDCWTTRHDPPHWVVSANFADATYDLVLRARQASGEALWLNLSSGGLERAHP